MNPDIQIIVLDNRGQRHIYIFAENRRAELLRTLGRHASEGILSWFEAAQLSQRVRNMEACVGK